jgi:peptide/nickel transport system substrate-binding protein
MMRVATQSLKAHRRLSLGRRALAGLLAPFGSVLAVACQSPADKADMAGELPRDSLVVMASGSDLESGHPLVAVHPLTRQLHRHALFVTLVRLDSLLQPIPYFARSWEWSADRTTLTLSLDSTLRWHDGVPTTADDVVFTLRAVQDSTVASPRRADLSALQSVDTLGRHQVRLTFAAPQPRLPLVLAELPLAPRHLLDSVPRDRWRQSQFATRPVGNGPFRFAARVTGRQWRFVRNTGFPASMGGPPQMAGLVIAVVDEATTKFAGLVSGDLDVAGVSPAMASLVARDSALRLLSPPVLFSNTLVFNTTRAPLDDVRVRRAFSLALGRTRIVQAAVAGFGTPASSVLPPGLPMAPPPAIEAPDTRRRAEAEQLLDAAGWRRPAPGQPRQRNGQPLRVELLTVGSGDMAIEQLVQADLQAIGVRLELRVMELATFLSSVRGSTKTFDLALTGIPGDIGLGYLVAMFDGEQAGGALDYSGFHRPGLTAAIREARRTEGDAQRNAWQVVDSILMAEQPVAFLYHARGVQGLSRRLGGVTMDLRGELAFVSQWYRTP